MGQVLALGGTATLGKHVARPFATLLEGVTGGAVLNLGALNAGPDYYLAEPAVLRGLGQARLAILQLAGAEGVTNPFYRVHSRRNDRFLGATPALCSLFPDVDLAEVHFTRHLLSVLHQTDPARHAVVVRVLQATWLARMQALLHHLPPRRILLLLSRPAVPDDPLHPALVDRAMTARLCGPATVLVEVALPDKSAVPGTCLPDAEDHHLIAHSLRPHVAQIMGQPRLVLRQADRVD